MRAFLLGVFLLAAGAARAEHATVIVGDHPDYGRLVVQMDAPTPAVIVQRGNQVEISLVSNNEIVAPDRVPRNVVSFQGAQGKAIVKIAPGARIKQAQSGRLIIIDIIDPRRRAKGAKTILATRPNPLWAPVQLASQITHPALQPSLSPIVPAAAPSASAALSEAEIPLDRPEPTEPPTAVSSTDVSLPDGTMRAPIRLPASPEVGAVAFRRGQEGVVVFDDALSLDPDVDPEKAHVDLQHRQGGTILTVKLEEGETLALAREDGDWVVRTGPVTATPAGQTALPDGIAFQFSRPGRTMTISDPLTGQLLLLGTVRQASATQSLIDARREAPGYVLLPTWLGLALEVDSDAVDLRVSQAGFTLQIPDKSAPGTAAVAIQENQFHIPMAPAAILLRQLVAQIVSAATAAPRNRGSERMAAARTMLALGLATEAEALLTLAANDDPAIAADPQMPALQGVAAILAGRPAEATGLDNPSLSAGVDAAMWRGIRDAAQGKPTAMLGSAWPSLATYPEAIRKRIAPTVIEAAIAHGDTVPPSELEGPGLAIARAQQLEKSGDVDGAIEAFTAVAAGRDERDSVRATLEATELRLSHDKVKPAESAAVLERQAVRWRGDGREEAMRFRAAELHRQAGQWRAALDLLRETGTLFPQSKDRAATASTDVFKALLTADDASVKPLELVTIAGDFADRLPGGDDGEKLAILLADKLAALDLPSRAIPVLKRLADQTSAPKAHAAYSLRLAQLQMDAGDGATVESGLATLDLTSLTPAQSEQRLFLLARARAARGDPAAAAEALAQLDGAAGAEARAGLLAKAGDWRGSLAALKLAVAKSVPASGALNEAQQDLVLREATAAVHAGDPDMLKRLKSYDGRLKGPRGDLFKVLTATAIESPDDLPRSAQELAMTKTLPDRLNAMKLR